MKKWFTLVEILIVTVIVGMLGVILMQTYVTMTRIAFRVQQEKQVTEQAVMFTQVLQNFADTMTIDYTRYTDTQSATYLVDNQGMVPVLYLTGAQGTVAIDSVGNCAAQVLREENDCVVRIQQNDESPFTLTHTGRATITALQFKIIPYATDKQYFENPSLCPNNLWSCLYHPGFWVLTQVYTPHIRDTRETNIVIPIQAFFSLLP